MSSSMTPTFKPNQDLSRLELLPTELVQHIASNLDYVDKTTFSAVSQQINYLVGRTKPPYDQDDPKHWLRMNLLRVASEHPNKALRACLECLELIPCDHQFQVSCLYFDNSSPEEQKQAMNTTVGSMHMSHRCRPRDNSGLEDAWCLALDYDFKGAVSPTWASARYQNSYVCNKCWDISEGTIYWKESFWEKSRSHAIVGILVLAEALFHVTFTGFLFLRILYRCWELTKDEPTANPSRSGKEFLFEVLQFANNFLTIYLFLRAMRSSDRRK